MTHNESETIWTRPFVLLCLTEFLSYGHNSLLTPTLPLYITHMGGTPILVGVMLAVFCATSVLVRPKIGYWADTWSYAGILSLGSLLLGISVLLYLFSVTTALIISNGFRGIGWAGLNTGGYSLLAHSAPDKRRGEASGYYSSFQSCAHVLFPALALWILDAHWGGFNAVIFLSATLALLGGGIGFILKPMTEQAAAKSSASPSTRQGQRATSTLVDRNVLVAAALLFCMYLIYADYHEFYYSPRKGVGDRGYGLVFRCQWPHSRFGSTYLRSAL